MSSYNYGMSSSAAMDPKVFMVRALKKCILNNKNIERFMKENNKIEVKKRAYNSIKLLEEMDMRLNKKEENEVVDRVSLLFRWLVDENTEVMEKWEENEEFYLKKILDTNPTLENLLESFQGLE